MGSRGVLRPGSGADRWFEIKSQVHQKLLNSLTPEQLKNLSKDSVRGQVGTVVEKLVIDEQLPMTMAERERLIEEILDEVFGLGPLEASAEGSDRSATSWSTASTTSTSSAPAAWSRPISASRITPTCA